MAGNTSKFAFHQWDVLQKVNKVWYIRKLVGIR